MRVVELVSILNEMCLLCTKYTMPSDLDTKLLKDCIREGTCDDDGALSASTWCSNILWVWDGLKTPMLYCPTVTLKRD